jgi:hypothetical protein
MRNKTRRNIKNKTHKKLSSKGWSQKSPGISERRKMKEDCGRKCFLGPIGESSFPICTKGTCDINPKGIYAAFVRARQYSSKKTTYRKIATRAKKMLKKRGYYM